MLIPFLTVFWLHSLSLVDAHATRDNVGCRFHLSCSGSFNGSIGQKSSGQARASSDVSSPSLFTWFGDAFSDQQGSGCWWTPPTLTLQCDKNQQPDHGFQIGCNGTVSFNSQTVFYECPTGQGDEVNLYLKSNGGQCHEITIEADGCAPSSCPEGGVIPPGGGGGAGPVPGAANSPSASSGPATAPSTLATSPSPGSGPSPSSQGPPIPSPFTTGNGSQPTTTTRITSTTTVTTTQPPASPTTSSECVVVEPDRIILTDKGNPDTAYGPNEAMHIQVSPNASSIFNFRFEDTDAGKMCEMLFLLPPGSTSGSTSPTTNSSGSGSGNTQLYTLTGTGMVTFAALDDWADANTTYRTSPRVVETLSNTLLDDRGVALGFGRFACPGSTTRAGVILTEDPLADTCLDCLQGNGIGMFLRKC